jgi:hypothetical protein
VVGRRRWCNGETYIFPFFSQSFFSLPVIYHHRRRSSVHSCSFQKLQNLWVLKNFIVVAYFNKRNKYYY